MMKSEVPRLLEKGRIRTGPLASPSSFGFCGNFIIPAPNGQDSLKVISSDGSEWPYEGEPWEHVSVSVVHAFQSGFIPQNRCPTWEEMEYVKRLCWRRTEVVIQLHVAEEDHISFHPYVLHLWRPTQTRIPLPPKETVAPIQEEE